jgi:hypothetical protein
VSFDDLKRQIDAKFDAMNNEMNRRIHTAASLPEIVNVIRQETTRTGVHLPEAEIQRLATNAAKQKGIL